MCCNLSETSYLFLFLLVVVFFLLPKDILRKQLIRPYKNKIPLYPKNNIIFPIAWSILYTLMIICYVIYWETTTTNESSSYDEVIRAMILLNTIVNVLWTRAMNFSFILGLVLAVLIMLTAGIIGIFFALMTTDDGIYLTDSYYGWIMFALYLPYILWSIFAVYLNTYLLILQQRERQQDFSSSEARTFNSMNDRSNNNSGFSIKSFNELK